MKMLLAIPFALALAGCVTPAVLPPDTPKAVVIKTRVDEHVAVAAKALSDNCALVQTGITVAQLFVKGENARAVVNKAARAVASYCSGPPPTDTTTALANLARIYADVMRAVPEAKAHMPDIV